MQTELLCISVLSVASGRWVELASALTPPPPNTPGGLRAAVCDCGTP